MKRTCNECTAMKSCKRTFGEFWKYKSNGGIGCEYPMTSKWAKSVEDELSGTKQFKSMPSVVRQTEMRIV